MRYVILEHDHPELHYDLMIENGSVLRTWKLRRPPMPGVPQECQPLGDHRRAYLDYQGPVSGNRGRVIQWDAGEWHGDAAHPDRIEGRVAGRRLRGLLRLVRDGGGWTLHYAGGDQ